MIKIYRLSLYNLKLSVWVRGNWDWNTFLKVYVFMDKLIAVVETLYNDAVKEVAVPGREVHCMVLKQDSPGFKF